MKYDDQVGQDACPEHSAISPIGSTSTAIAYLIYGTLPEAGEAIPEG